MGGDVREMTRKQAILELHAVQYHGGRFGSGDPEAEHQKADGVLCKLLTDLGYGDVVREYGLVHKWYA